MRPCIDRIVTDQKDGPRPVAPSAPLPPEPMPAPVTPVPVVPAGRRKPAAPQE